MSSPSRQSVVCATQMSGTYNPLTARGRTFKCISRFCSITHGLRIDNGYMYEQGLQLHTLA